MSHIKLSNINLIYEITAEKRIKDILIPKGRINNCLEDGRKIHAVKNVSLEINDGDRLGIIGRNGAGKSSLLKIIAGIYPHTNGKLEVEGSMATLFESGVGFEMHATGWDNIYLRGLMLGGSPQSIKSKIKEIAEFSELGEYLNIAVKYYSTGMFVRLAFATSALMTESDILILDESIAAGDAFFLGKALKRLRELADKVKILVFVTHDMELLGKLCNKCIWMENGSVKMYGSTKEVSESYLKGF